MRSEADIKQVIDWLRHAQGRFDPKTHADVIGCMDSQIDVLLWALEEPTYWDKVYLEMLKYHASK